MLYRNGLNDLFGVGNQLHQGPAGRADISTQTAINTIFGPKVPAFFEYAVFRIPSQEINFQVDRTDGVTLTAIGTCIGLIEKNFG